VEAGLVPVLVNVVTPQRMPVSLVKRIKGSCTRSDQQGVPRDRGG